MIIDSQVHTNEANSPRRPWHSVPNWPPHVTGDEMVAAMDDVGVDGAIFISAFSLYQYDGSYASSSTTWPSCSPVRRPRRRSPGPTCRRSRPGEAAQRADLGERRLHAVEEAHPFPDIWDPLRRLFDAWGFELCLWGTDWTRAFTVVHYEQAVRPFLETDRLSDGERAMLMCGSCANAYGWTPNRR